MPLPTHRVEIRKSMYNSEWSNDYHIVATSLADASAQAAALAAMERAFHWSNVMFLWSRVSTVTPGDRKFVHKDINQPGQLVLGTYTILPIFNTMRVDMGTAESDPARKYYRMPIIEEDVINGQIDAARRTQVQGILSPVLVGANKTATVVTGKGDAVTSVSVFPAIQMRQTRRRRRKKVATGGTTV